MSDEERQDFGEVIADAIRQASASGRLAGRAELRAALRSRGMPDDQAKGALDLDALLAVMLATHEDLAALPGISGETLYHSPPLLSRTYAAILDRKSSPLLLIAEEVRQSSAEYPRPVCLDLFEHTPFDLTPEQIQVSLQSMAASVEYADITFTTTSTGAVYLFSTRYLDRPYAAFLAERAETGLLLNP